MLKMKGNILLETLLGVLALLVSVSIICNTAKLKHQANNFINNYETISDIWEKRNCRRIYKPQKEKLVDIVY